jgi:DNA-binding PadR family transcriptional regulator
MKKRVPVVANERDFEILLFIFQNKNYNEILAKELNVKPSSIFEQLKYLEKEKFIISKREKKQFNRNIYSVNFKRIAEEFVNDLELSIREDYKSPVPNYLNNPSNWKEKSERINKELIKMKNNPILLNHFRTFFLVKFIADLKLSLKLSEEELKELLASSIPDLEIKDPKNLEFLRTAQAEKNLRNMFIGTFFLFKRRIYEKEADEFFKSSEDFKNAQKLSDSLDILFEEYSLPKKLHKDNEEYLKRFSTLYKNSSPKP